MTPDKRKDNQATERINDYLESGGLFNPEMMEHDKVRELLMDCREKFATQEKVIASLKTEASVSKKTIEGLVKVLKIPGHDAACNEGEFCYPRCPKRIAKEAVAKAKEAMRHDG